MVRLRLLAAALCLAQPCARGADDQVIITDRPNLVESSKVVGTDRFQVEAGVLFERDRTAQVRAHTVATPTLLRYGIADTLELRLETEGRTVAHSTDLGTGMRATLAGYADTALGVKWHVADALGNTPSMALLAHANLPSGSRGMRGRGVRPSLRLTAEWDLPDGMSLGVMPGIGVAGEDDGPRYGYGILGVTVGKSFDDRLSGFAEIALPQIARGADGGTQVSVDVGATYLLSNTVQVDAMVTRGLNGRTPDWTWTVGLSFKL